MYYDQPHDSFWVLVFQYFMVYAMDFMEILK